VYGVVTDGGIPLPGTAVHITALREDTTRAQGGFCGTSVEAIGADTTDSAGAYRIHMIGGSDAFEVQTCIVMQAFPPPATGLPPVTLLAGTMRFAMEVHALNPDSFRVDVTLPR
jgi:hypothetical protein